MFSISSTSATSCCYNQLFPYRTTSIPMLSSIITKLNTKFSATTIVSSSSSISTTDEKEQPSSASRLLEELKSGLSSTSSPFPPIKVAKRIVLVRHGQSTWNAEGRIQGSSDYSVLTQKGEAQAETSRQMLVDDGFDVCFASPLARSKRTADIIWGNRGEAIITDSDLREIDLYSFQGLLKHEGKEKFGAAFQQWQLDAPNFSIDGHYPVRELWSRATNCWSRILAHESKSVLVVAHNAVNQALIATAIGLGTEYFRILVQSNCGVSVLDFTPRLDGRSPYVSLNRLNQTPSSPIADGISGGRKSSQQIILVCHGSSQNNAEDKLPQLGDQPMNMLGVIQSQKIAELLLDLKLDTIISSPRKASMETAVIISKVQEAADYLGADCVPRYVDMKELRELDVENIFRQSKKDGIPVSDPTCTRSTSPEGYEDGMLTQYWDQSGKTWRLLLNVLSGDTKPQNNVVVIGHPLVHVALISHCLNLTKDWMGSFHLEEGSVSVIDFPDGPTGHGVVRCINYTAHLGRWSIPITKSTMDDEELY